MTKYRDGARTPWWRRIDWFIVVGALLSIAFILAVLMALGHSS